ncbi:hypothetical protein KHQ06_24545 [Nocardia tengchongensis]|uniref:Uncharacterized protein n=1 Tax=Nocardia tengchongensis TaxID=2055889 RepID=A0ABX8CHT8_9NOCA|nr:hypothetical protein [Nocardia tengchongensis]QVI19532.1 hypothetical protein KHQ06_24545 [Nocardia tengchongensis]
MSDRLVHLAEVISLPRVCSRPPLDSLEYVHQVAERRRIDRRAVKLTVRAWDPFRQFIFHYLLFPVTSWAMLVAVSFRLASLDHSRNEGYVRLRPSGMHSMHNRAP